MHDYVAFTSEANGFSIQLNGYSAVDDLDAAQQIVVFATPGSNDVVARIENWINTTHQPATTADLAPITAFQLNIGGDFGGQPADLTSAVGTITYAASAPMSAVNAAPQSFIDLSYSTVESANLTFGPLPVSANAAVSQSFGMTTDGSGEIAPAERAHGHRMRPATSVPTAAIA